MYMTTFKRNFNFIENLNIIIAKNVRKYRKIAGITQEQLAIDIDVSVDYLRRFETQEGREGISLKTLYKISVVLNTSIEKFLEDCDD